MQINNKLINRWVRNLEVVFTIICLLSFLDLRLPSPAPILINSLSYPVVATLVVLRCKRLAYVATRDIPLLLYIGIALFSILWTADQQRTLDSIRGLLRMFLFGAYIATRYTIKEQTKLLTWVFGITAIFSLVFALAIPSYGIGLNGWTGIFAYKNYMGNAMSITALLFLLAAFTARRRNWLAWMGFSLSMTLNLLSRSASSLVNILTLISLTSLYQLIKQNYKLRVIIFGGSCLLMGSITLLILNNVQIILVDILGKSLEFNGRTPIWTLAIDKGLEKPWLGYGLNAFWSSDAGIYVMLHTWSGFRQEGFNSHNSFLELFLNLGFLGILVYGITLLTTFIKTLILLITTKKIEIFTFLEFLVFMCIAGWSDTNFIMSAASSYCCIYVSIVLSIAMEWEKFSKELYSKKFLT